MYPKGGPVTEGLLRQRRNLIITCALLWLMKYGGVTFSKFSLAGFDVTFGNPEALTLSLWIAFVYFLFRYYQYFSSEGVATLTKVLGQALEVKCAPRIRSLVKSECPDNHDAVGYSYQHLKNWQWVYRGQKIGGDSLGQQVIVGAIELPISKWKLRNGIAAALLDTTFRNSVVTDYLLPFIFAAGIIWYCGANDWRGSFFRILWP